MRTGTRVALRMVPQAFVSPCPCNPLTELRKPQKRGHRGGAHIPDLSAGRRPDLPFAMAALTLIEGARADMLPAGPKRAAGED